jgi:hypothetical protein
LQIRLTAIIVEPAAFGRGSNVVVRAASHNR